MAGRAEQAARRVVRSEQVSRGEIQSISFTPRACTLADQAGRVGDPGRVEGEEAVAGLPGVVELVPADRDPRLLEPVDVVEHLGGAVEDVAPLDQLELRRAAAPTGRPVSRS